MNRKALQILKYMRTVDFCHRDELIRRFGSTYLLSLDYLLAEKYLEPKIKTKHTPHMESGRLTITKTSISTNVYRITGHGLDFLENYVWNKVTYWAPIVLSNLLALAALIVSILK